MNAPASTSILNDAQLAALDLGRDLLVSAGAGAGKTQVLGLRYLGIIEEGLATVPEIVAFTFTEKASAEMRERVQKLLLERINELASGNKQRLERLRRAQAEFARNRISTVHGFCHRLLKDFAWEAGLEPHAPILDERAQALARENAIRRVLMSTDAEDEPELVEALVRLGSVDRLHSLSGTLSSMLRNRAFMRPPLQRAVELWQDPKTEIERRRIVWKDFVDESLHPVIEAAAGLDYAAAGSVSTDDSLRQKLESIRIGVEQRDAEALGNELRTGRGKPARMGRKGTAKNWGSKDAIQRARSEVESLAQAFEPVGTVLDAKIDPDFEIRAAQVTRDLLVVFNAVCEAYRIELGSGLDFLELELRSLALLRDDSGVREQVVRKARYLLVDEYQDTNPTQGELFSLLTRGDDAPGRFFAVGDAKQSIYAFRGSDVRVFNHAMEWIPQRNEKSGVADKTQQLPWGLTCQDTPERRTGIVRLQHNYRTVKPLLETGNKVFAEIFDREDWRDFDARPQDMICGNDGAPPENPLEFHLIAHTGRATDDDEIRRKDNEAEFVAQTVKRLNNEGVPFSDITILVRKRTRNRQYRNAFARHNLPLLVVGEGGLFETQEALDCVNLLRTLANPNDNIAALGLLRSPFAGLSDRYLTELAFNSDGKQSLLDRVENNPQRPDEARQFFLTFEKLRTRAGRDAPGLLLTEALSSFAYPLAVGCGADAEQRLANVNRMIELVREMQRVLPSLAPLVRELRERIDRDEDETQGVPDRSAEGVRLMTVHKSKGLEFPVVILPELAGAGNKGDTGLVRHLPSRENEPLGLNLKRLDDEDDGKHRGEYRADFAGWLAKHDAKEREEAEEKRVLYVAWTRAEKRLILTGTVKTDNDFAGDSWADQLLQAFGVTGWGKAHGFINWHEHVQRTETHTHKPAIARVQKALDTGRLPLPDPIDTSLVAPIGEYESPQELADPEATEFGTLVHDALQRRLLLPGVEDMGALNVEADRHIRHATEALATLPKADRLLPEFELMTPDGPRRLDLLRILNNGEYQIIDYKTDAIESDFATHAENRHGTQLRGYADILDAHLNAHALTPRRIHLLVCFTAPDGLRPARRLVEIQR